MAEPPIQMYFSGTRETPRKAIFRSAMMRWAWRFYTQRLTQAGRWFFWPSIGFLMYGSITLDLQGYVPFCYCAAVWFFALVCIFIYQPRVNLDVTHSERVCAGETMPLDVSVEQRGSNVPLVILPHRLPEEMQSVPEDGIRLEGLARGEKTRVRLALRCMKRGVFVFKGVRAECDYPFGLLRTRKTLEFARQILVYPRFTRLARLELPTGRRYQPGGVALATSVGESFEYIGNREYRDGDNVRDIDWLATARIGKPVVREYREEYFLRVAVIMDTFVPKNAPPQRAEAFEHAVSLAASVSDCMARQEYLVDLFAAGPSLYHLTTGRSLAYLDQILDILACVESSATEPFDTMEPELMSNLAKISTVICVFLDWDDRRVAFVRKIADQGSAVKVVVVRDGPCTRDPFADQGLAGSIQVLTSEICTRGPEAL